MNYFRSTLLSISATCLLACGGTDSTTTEDGTSEASSSGGETTQTTQMTETTVDPSTGETTEGPTETSGSETEGSETMMETDPTGMPTDATDSDSDTTEPTESITETDSDSDTDTGGMCGVGGDDLHIELRDLDGNLPGCPDLEFNGALVEGGDGVWQLDNCPCGNECFSPDPWELVVDAPDIYLPEIPQCVRIVYTQAQGFDEQCHFTGIAIWPTDQLNGPLVYLAGGEVVPGVEDITVEAQLEETCTCEGCCGDDELHSLQFTAYEGSLHLQETEEGELPGSQVGFVYQTKNFKSHVSGLCDAGGDAFLWVLKLVIQA